MMVGLTQRDQDAEQLRAEDEAIATAGREQPYGWTAEAGVTEATESDLAELIATLSATTGPTIPQDDQS